MSTPAVESPPPNSRPKPGRAERVLRRYGPWALPVLLALVAYAPVVGIGFLADDWTLLREADQRRFDLGELLPRADWIFYRPVGTLLTWDLGWHLWGLHPLPYHLVGLMLHGLTALALAGALATASGQRRLGLWAGALFAVFPLHSEAVGWVAAQWDVLAACLGLAGLWAFVRWWRDGGRRYYLLALLGYGLGLFTKESLLAFLPVFALLAWLSRPPISVRQAARLLGALLPFGALLALNIGLRLATWGRLGGYGDADYPAIFWDNLAAYGRWLLAPLNPALFSAPVIQATLLLAGTLLAAGLVWYGRAYRYLLIVAVAWVGCSLLPVLSLGLRPDNAENNRFLYLAAGGYAVLVAALHQAWRDAAWGRGRRLVALTSGALVLAGIGTAWVQLTPWQRATVQARAIEQDLEILVPPEARPQGLVWYGQGVPDNYHGAFVYRMGLGDARYFANGDGAWIEYVNDALVAPLATDSRDAFALRFRFIKRLDGFQVDYLTGITGATAPPPAIPGAPALRWDFRACQPEAVGAWQPVAAQVACTPGAGLVIAPHSGDPQMVGPPVNLPLPGARGYLRLRVAARFPAGVPADLVQQWFWRGPQTDWRGDQARTLPIKPDSQWHVYWAAVPAGEVGAALAGLRYDPVTAPLPVTVAWIAVDAVTLPPYIGE